MKNVFTFLETLLFTGVFIKIRLTCSLRAMAMAVVHTVATMHAMAQAMLLSIQYFGFSVPQHPSRTINLNVTSNCVK